MRPFKFLNNKQFNLNEVATWDFYQDYNGEIGDHRIEVEWYDSFIDFLLNFNTDDYVLIDEIRMLLTDNTYIDINHNSFDTWVDEFTSHNGRVRIVWLNFDII
jgi:hypothetical protein